MSNPSYFGLRTWQYVFYCGRDMWAPTYLFLRDDMVRNNGGTACLQMERGNSKIETIYFSFISLTTDLSYFTTINTYTQYWWWLFTSHGILGYGAGNLPFAWCNPFNQMFLLYKYHSVKKVFWWGISRNLSSVLSLITGTSTVYLEILITIQRICYVIGPDQVSQIQSLSHRCKLASLYKYFHLY